MKRFLLNQPQKRTNVRLGSLSSVRRGMTLIEILVVVGIIMVLASLSMPVLSPVAEGRVARETARGVQAAMEAARARAIRLGRPCGVSLVPFHENYPYGCIKVEQLTAPPGFVTDCSVGTYGITPTTFNGITFKNGDTAQLNFTGPIFTYVENSWTPSQNAGFGESYDYADYGETSGTATTSAMDMKCTVNLFPVPDENNPFSKALGIETSYILPKGYILDLYDSGIGWNSVKFGSGGFRLSDRYPPMILFRPDGTASVFINGQNITQNNARNQEDQNIYLLVGSWSKMRDSSGNSLADDEETYRTNLEDPYSYWVVVNSANGMITLAQNNQNNIDRIRDQSKARGGN